MKIEKIKFKISDSHFGTLAHLFLAFGFAVGALAIFKVRYSATSQFIVVLLLCAFYLTWGFVYHNLKRDFSAKLFLEYLAIAAIAMAAGFLVFVG